MLTAEQSVRYSRHLKLPGFNPVRQRQLLESRVLIVGAGGLGCPFGLYLAAAGIGTIGVVDYDQIELSNLQRQIAFNSEDIGKSKAKQLVKAMEGLNPDLSYKYYAMKLDSENAVSLIGNYDLVVDCTDNFATRFLLTDVSYLCNKPLLQGAVHQYNGQIILFLPKKTACYRCIFRYSPQSKSLLPCSETGVFGTLPGTIGTIMATEAIKFLTDMQPVSLGHMLLYDGNTQEIRRLTLNFDIDCPLCGKEPSIKGITTSTDLACDNVVYFPSELSISVAQAKDYVKAGANLIDVREPMEYEQAHLANAKLLPLSSLIHDQTQLSPTEAVTLVYCQKGIRSLLATKLLREAGVSNCYSIAGGIEAWFT